MAVTWKDAVKINGKVFFEEFPINGEMDGEDILCIDEFIQRCAEKHGVSEDDIKVRILDEFDFDPKELGHGIEEFGMYIDGVPEWTLTDGELQPVFED